VIRIKLSNNKGYEWWTNLNNLSIKGYFFDGENTLYNNGVNLEFDINDLDQKLKQLNGFFSLVYKKDRVVFAAVDKLRSIPLFYCHINDDFFISDDVTWLKKQINETEMDIVAVEEFLLTGYVTGSDTLFPNIKQLKAGEYLEYIEDDNRLVVSRYFEYRHIDLYTESLDKLISDMDELHVRVFKRLIKTLDGRQAVIPLSGGYDSRLIAIMLKRLNYKNIICFTYGKSGNNEAKISKQVADSLGLEWHHILYNEEIWKKHYESEQYKQYLDYGSNYSSMAHVQDFIAVKELRDLEIIQEDAVFIPGHAYDFIAGSHIPPNMIGDEQIDRKAILKIIIEKHYNLWKWDKSKHEINNKLKAKINQELGVKSYRYNEELADDYEYWGWQERQSKFICNSVRVYEFWGYEWRLPLWDDDLMAFWSRVPVHLRVNRSLFFYYVNNNDEFKSLELPKSQNSNQLNNTIKRFVPKIHRDLSRTKSMIYDSQGWFGLYNSRMKLRYILKGGSNVNSGLALDYIRSIKNSFKH
jgi:asparagine synthase (glutamine-hydrolysing)